MKTRPNYPLPEPKPLAADSLSPEQLERFVNHTPVYPSDCLIEMFGGITGEQAIHFRQEDIAEDVVWARDELDRSEDFEDFLRLVVERIKNQYPGDAQKWMREYVDKNRCETTTLDEVRVAEAANCFIRSVVFVGILQSLGIEARVAQGDWIDTSRERVVGEYALGQEIQYQMKTTISNTRLLEGEEAEVHAFAFVKHEGAVYFADPALWVKNEDGTPIYPLVRKTSEDELSGRDIVFKLPNGLNRHYAFKFERGVTIEPSPATTS